MDEYEDVFAGVGAALPMSSGLRRGSFLTRWIRSIRRPSCSPQKRHLQPAETLANTDRSSKGWPAVRSGSPIISPPGHTFKILMKRGNMNVALSQLEHLHAGAVEQVMTSSFAVGLP